MTTLTLLSLGAGVQSTTLARTTRTERQSWQGDLLDLLAEQGDPDGCSPWSCRSGTPTMPGRPA